MSQVTNCEYDDEYVFITLSPDSSLPREDDISEELGSITPVGPNTPLLTSTTTTDPKSHTPTEPSSPTPRVEFITPGQVITTISSGGAKPEPAARSPMPQHQELELEPEMLFVSEDEVINLAINPSSRNFVASTILEVEEEEEGEPELEAMDGFDVIEPLQQLDRMVEPLQATATFVADEPEVITKAAAQVYCLTNAHVYSFLSSYNGKKCCTSVYFPCW